MKLSINGESLEIIVDQQESRTLLSNVLDQYAATPPFAVAVNGEFVANSTYHETWVSTHDNIDVVSPIFGG